MFILLLLLSCGSNDMRTERQHTYQNTYNQKLKLSFTGLPTFPENDRLGFTNEKPKKVKLMSPIKVIYASSLTQPPIAFDED